MADDPLAHLSTPDITPTDIASGAAAILGVVSAFGLDMTDAQKGAIIGAIVAVWGAVTVIADMLRRRKRAAIVIATVQAAADIESSKAHAAARIAEATAPAAPLELEPGELEGADLPPEDLDPPAEPEEDMPDGDDRLTRETGGETVPKARGSQS